VECIVFDTQLITIFIFQLLSPLLISPEKIHPRKLTIHINLIIPLVLNVALIAFPVLAEDANSTDL
jgi:hypothetical protein